MRDSATTSGPLERWTPQLFLVAGTILVGYSILYGTEAYLDTYPAVRVYLGPIGYIMGFTGLLGMYPALAKRSPKLAGAGAIFAATGIVGWLMNIAESAGMLTSAPGALGAAEGILILVGMILAFLTFAIASLRTDAQSRTIGLLLLGPFLVNAVNFGFIFAGQATAEARFVTSGLWAMTHLAIGIGLRTEDSQTGRTDAQPTEVAR